MAGNKGMHTETSYMPYHLTGLVVSELWDLGDGGRRRRNSGAGYIQGCSLHLVQGA